jgi:tyrosyl-tRNA synthetase
MDHSAKSVDLLLTRFERTTDAVVTLDELRNRMLSGRQLVFKYGVDLTAPLLHIGHAVNLWMYRLLQENGHKIVLLLGDFTTRIGDPTGKNATRPILSEDEIASNRDAILRQAMLVLHDDPEVLEVRRNSEWLEPLGSEGLLGLMTEFTVDRMLSRDMFRARAEAGAAIRLHELVYPLLQGWDSVPLRADGVIVGSDQLFNEMIGRDLQARNGLPPQVVLTTKITPGIDGREKQSKSLGNFIALDHSPREKFGRLMSIPDELTTPYMSIYAGIDNEALATFVSKTGGSPMQAKLTMAEAITRRWHGADAAAAERQWFVDTFSNRAAPEDAPIVRVAAPSIAALDLASAIAPALSRNQLRRLIRDGALRVEGQKVGSPDEFVPVSATETQVRLGKRTWARVVAS